MARKYIDVRVVGAREELIEFIWLLRTLRELSWRGHNREFKVSIDGDGSGKMNFLLPDGNGGFEEVPTIEGFDPENIPDISIGE